MHFHTPRLKSTVEYCSIDSKIYFFSRPGVALELEDRNYFILNVCKLLDGKKTLAQILEIISKKFPTEANYLEDLLTVLNKEYLLEDNYTTNNLSEYDLDRWSRNIEFFGTYCNASDNKYLYQEKLKFSKVAVFGLGGVGSNILLNLAALGVGNIKAVDFDEVQLSNLNRQILYNEADLGILKSEVARERLQAFSPNTNFEFLNKKIKSAEDIGEIIHDQDFVISAIDQPRETMMDWFNEACIKYGLPFITGGLDSRLAMCYTIIPGKTGCIECWKFGAQDKNLLFQNLVKHQNFVPSTSPNVAIMPLISIVSGLVGSEFLKLVTGIGQPKSLGQVCTFDYLSTEIIITEKWEKNSACLVCGMG